MFSKASSIWGSFLKKKKKKFWRAFDGKDLEKKKVLRIQQHADGMYNLLRAELIENVTHCYNIIILFAGRKDDACIRRKKQRNCLNALSPSLQSSVVAAWINK